MKNSLFKILGLTLLFASFITFVTCSDDDDNPPPVINKVIVVSNPDTGMFSSINLADGVLTSLGVVTLEGETVLGIRDIVFNPANGTVYASSKANDPYNGKVYSINPATLEATVINDNADEDWYALPGLEMSNGKLFGTVYWDDYDPIYNESTGLIWLNLDGSFIESKPLIFEDENYSINEGMAIEYGASNNEILMTYGSDILVSDINGNISEIIDINGEGFPMDSNLDSIRTLETGNNGILYGIDRHGNFGSINLTTAVFTYIATLPSEKIVALSNIPETIFE
ncbi:hypothetical protein [Winogradskyella sp.]|uniref:hypothetical protein n=1 Tax=Winogradskyella sp. TaxID=1883156 RepID=UPI0025F374B5|nr:hypothetical protein [Winogradskyella sp.]